MTKEKLFVSLLFSVNSNNDEGSINATGELSSNIIILSFSNALTQVSGLEVYINCN